MTRFFPCWRIAGVILLFLSFPCAPSPGQSAEERAFLQAVLADARAGSYRRAEADLRDYLDTYPEDPRALEGLCFVERMQGRYARALATADAWARAAGEPVAALGARAELLERLGRYEEAEETLRSAWKRAPGTLATTAPLARFLYDCGRREEARALGRKAVADCDPASLDGRDLCRLGELYRILGDLERAAEAGVYADASLNGKKGAHYRVRSEAPLLLLGEVYRRTRMGSGSGNRAVACYQDILSLNPRHPGALLGLARTRFYAYRFHDARARVEQALAVNPFHAEALAFYAHLLLILGRYDLAEEAVARGLSVNPRHKGLLAASAAAHLLRGDRKGCDTLLEKALESDPAFGEAAYRLAEVLAYHYRFPEAERAVRRCLEIDPEFSEAYVLLGRILANLGREKEARAALLSSMRRDPYPYPWRENMLTVLSELKDYERIRSDPFTLLLPPGESRLMRPYLQARGRESIRVLVERYGFRLKGPLLVEVFPSRDDFDVRTVGFTGLGALGACFGKVITLFCPSKGPYRGRFSWSATFHHELAHAFTLPLSRFRIPRWLTEGISVYEEERVNSWWRRNMDFEIYNDLHNDRLFTIEGFDAGFMGPRVLLAYTQAGLMVKYLVERYGQEKLRALVCAYGEDLDTNAAFRKALSVGPKQVDGDFRAWLAGGLFAGVKCRPLYDREKQLALLREAQEDPGDPVKQARAAWACFQNGKLADARYFLGRAEEKQPGNGPCLLLRGDLAWKAGDREAAEGMYRKAVQAGAEDLFAYRALALMARDRGDRKGAVTFLEKAVACFPTYIGPGSPHRMLLQLRLEAGEKEQAAQEMKAIIAAGAQDLELFRKLGLYHEARGETEGAAACFRAAVSMDPFRRDLHFHLARALAAQQAYTEALDELEYALATGAPPRMPGRGEAQGPVPSGEETDLPSDADLHAERGAIFLALGDEEEARKEAEAALSLTPDHEKAVEVLHSLRAREGGGNR